MFEYSYGRAVAGLVAVPQVLLIRARLAAGEHQRLLGGLPVHGRSQRGSPAGELPGGRLPDRLVPAAAPAGGRGHRQAGWLAAATTNYGRGVLARRQG